MYIELLGLASTDVVTLILSHLDDTDRSLELLDDRHGGPGHLLHLVAAREQPAQHKTINKASVHRDDKYNKLSET